MQIPELLAPAGNLEKLKVAVHYGADAVYLGGARFGLRSQADNFTPATMAEAVAYAHDRGVKVYLTVNSYPDTDELEELDRYLEEVAPIPFDAFIAADPGVIATIRRIVPDRTIHLSTQANTTTWRSALFWQQQGISRINLAREMSLEAIRETRRRVSAELEVFAHGALCVAYSGRCLLSAVMTGRHANRGECTHPCRWSYALVEESRPGEYYPVTEDENGTFIFNSRDLCLIRHIPELVEAGVDSLKIEGRMKGIHYVASVVRVYREALDRYAADPAGYAFRPEWLEELSKVSHRGYTTGFLLGRPEAADLEYDSRYLRSHDFLAVVDEILPDGTAILAVRNRIRPGWTMELMGPGMRSDTFRLDTFTDENGAPLTEAHPNQRIRTILPEAAAPWDLLRRERDD
ncbi:U32 family peptidase [Geobacter sulfurreducens]|jgi:putative protease|uniref:Peptidase, U32 family n=1 Tax=Geobacter sulfurreducens (strain ATCC 51573 / DSM 12127 / PCA) TaxID=243231 RepID=Q74A35_GEOSL|nr:U32 family peptidase [Geobacter sulfurreducens]AAR35929.1 peptidase, U32 family [Geobacter sulfurreducens PCA]ADI85314.1 peptidase, U32 family [Geobacter sulfurreducens KN400]AJY68844.1 peptidase U32 [Geobacter sulfurreducens]UAC03252.1 U32 family peptidase [Geobacter sulfurreducens]UTG91906.1 U32 family peptidase [Geobacter sulfurreducens]